MTGKRYLNSNDRNNSSRPSNTRNKDDIYKKFPLSNEMNYNSHLTPHNAYSDDFNEINVQLNQSLDINKKLTIEVRTVRDELEKYKIMNDKYKEKYMEILTRNNEETNQHEKVIRNLRSEVKEREQRLKDIQRLENDVSNLKRENQELEAKNTDLVQRNADLENQLGDLNKKNALLEDEASSYQSALGVATNFQLGDNDQNNAVNLNHDIMELNDKIRKYITNLKQDIVVNMNEVKKLLLHYGCPTNIENQKEDRTLIQAVLQRHVIETIFEYANQYFQSTGKHYHLESDITKSESSLSLLLNHASKCRTGNDEITRVGPSKLRQQIYSVLSNRGFADIIGAGNNGNTIHEHPFIVYHKKKLNEVMNELRMIKSSQKRTTSENLAATIIRDVVKIFCFRLKVQEPAVNYRWFPNNSTVDKALMEVANLDDKDDSKDEVVNSRVDLCFFPLIGRDVDSKNRKIYTLAKVITKPALNLKASRNY